MNEPSQFFTVADVEQLFRNSDLKSVANGSLNYLFDVGNDPLSCISSEGSEKSTSNISRAAVVLKEASSCCADVPKARYIGWCPAGLHAWWAVLWISFSLIFLQVPTAEQRKPLHLIKDNHTLACMAIVLDGE